MRHLKAYARVVSAQWTCAHTGTASTDELGRVPNHPLSPRFNGRSDRRASANPSRSRWLYNRRRRRRRGREWRQHPDYRPA